MISIRAQRKNWSNSIEFAVFERLGDEVSHVTSVNFELVKDAAIQVRPSFSLSPEQAQQLMDDLWICGLRPSEGTGSAGALKATQDHLNDMRKLVFQMMENK